LSRNVSIGRENRMVQQEKYGRYAIFANGGKQYQAIEGLTVAIEKIDGETGDTFEINTVLFRKLAEGQFEIGQPLVDGKITATIVKQTKDPKVIVFKFKRRKKVRVKNGHRQPKTIIRIDTIA
ncbi:MAG TPA: 50S ribosomal protein L21, partial [Candidatus Babeliales bacterium]|nr:50S ribosomal protein L21 [Candidatus Babeliales bacterium]